MIDYTHELNNKLQELDEDMRVVYQNCVSTLSNIALEPEEIIWCIDNRSLPCKADEREELKKQMTEFVTAMQDFAG